MGKHRLIRLVEDVRGCTLCEPELQHGVRPVLQLSAHSRVLIAGQAPGAKVHATGIPFDDPSGERLRDWMGVDRATFYDAEQVAILPMGFCYPGKGKSGDLPPMKRCASTWRARLLEALPSVKLMLVIGQYAQDWHLDRQENTLTATVAAWKSYPSSVVPLPHPSPRNNIWMKKNPWFATELLPVVRARVAAALNR